MSTKEVKAILFDLDGTLRDSRDAIYGAIDFALGHYGVTADSSEYQRDAHSLRLVHQKYVPESVYEEFRAQYDTAFDADSLASIIIYEHVVDVLENLRNQGYKLAIVSSSRYAREGLDAHDLGHYFDVVIGGNDVNKHKPHPEPIFAATTALGVRVDESIMVGDMIVDIEAGKAAGVLATIGLTHGFGKAEDLLQAGADHVIDSMAELPAIVKQLEVTL
jgi:HAD superfamily hydrolase (TIGR01549 family)